MGHPTGGHPTEPGNLRELLTDDVPKKLATTPAPAVIRITHTTWVGPQRAIEVEPNLPAGSATEQKSCTIWAE